MCVVAYAPPIEYSNVNSLGVVAREAVAHAWLNLSSYFADEVSTKRGVKYSQGPMLAFRERSVAYSGVAGDPNSCLYRCFAYLFARRYGSRISL